jgi:hypothetical protein
VVYTLSILNWNVREACQISLLNMCMEAERTAVCRARGVYLESLIKDVKDVRVMSSLPLNRKREKRIIKSMLLFVWCKGNRLSIPKSMCTHLAYKDLQYMSRSEGGRGDQTKGGGGLIQAHNCRRIFAQETFKNYNFSD